MRALGFVQIAGFDRSYYIYYDGCNITDSFLLEGLFVVRSDLSVTPVGNNTITVPNEGPDVLPFSTPQRLVVVVKKNMVKWGRVHQSCVVQVEFVELDGCNDVAHGYGRSMYRICRFVLSGSNINLVILVVTIGQCS